MGFTVSENPQTNSYKDILQLNNSTAGMPAATPVPVCDGAGTASPLALSATTVSIGGTPIKAIGKPIVVLTAATLTLSPLLHAGQCLVVNKADGTAITLPAATGSGAEYEIFIGTTITSVGTTIKVANANDTMVGFQDIAQDGGSTNLTFEIGGTDDTITLDGSTKGGIKGDTIYIKDIAANLFRVIEKLSGTGTEVINTSATV